MEKRIPVSYLDGGNGGGALLHNNEVVYMLHAGDLIDSYGFPILKKKACSASNIEQIIIIKRFLENSEKNFQKTAYAFIDRALKENQGFPSKELEEFYNNHIRIYIYGNGKYAERLRLYFKFKDWTIAGIIVTRKKADEDALEYETVDFQCGDGIIIAVGAKYSMEIYANIKRQRTDLDVFLMSE